MTDHVRVTGARLHVPGPMRVRLSVVAGNIRVRQVIDAVVSPGDVVVDVGANIGYNTVHAAQRVGPAGRVVAIEPAPDNRAILQQNVDANDLRHVVVDARAAGRAHETRAFYLRGAVSAVNSLFEKSCYASVTDVMSVAVAPLDEMVEGRPSLVKIDVEGAELDVLAGMPRVLRTPGLWLIIEWHPLLQAAAGYDETALPNALFDQGFTLHAATHLRTRSLSRVEVPALAARLRRSGRPVELIARKG